MTASPFLFQYPLYSYLLEIERGGGTTWSFFTLTWDYLIL